MADKKTATEEQMKQIIEWATGIKFDDLLNDDEKYVTFWEVNHRAEIADRRYRETGDSKYLKQREKAYALLNKMVQMGQDEGKYLHMKPSELSELLQ